MLSRNPPLAWARNLLGGMLTLALVLAAPAAAQEDLTPLDVLMLKSVSGAYPSPGGDVVVFTRSDPRGPDEGVGGGVRVAVDAFGGEIEPRHGRPVDLRLLPGALS